MTYSYIRVSTDKQTTQNQKFEIANFARNKGMRVDEWIVETASGIKKACDRKLGSLLGTVKKGDVILVSELSRLGRDTLQVLEVIQRFNELGISLYIQNYNIETLNEDGTINPMSQFLVTILAEVARMERKTIRERVESGYKNYRANGGRVGRREGYRKSAEAIKGQYAEEMRVLRKGLSLRNIAKITGTSVNTIRKCRSLIG